MIAISPSELLSRAAYEAEREAFRRRIMVLKAKRRVAVGDHATVHFETRDTMLYQVHEMLRAESSWDRPGAVADELAAYNPLIPADGCLSATLMLEYETPEERAVHLSELLGLDRHLWLVVGDRPPLLASFDQAQVAATRISSVQYLRFPLDAAQRAVVATPGAVLRVVIDHPRYQAQAVLGEETRRELAADLAD